MYYDGESHSNIVNDTFMENYLPEKYVINLENKYINTLFIVTDEYLVFYLTYFKAFTFEIGNEVVAPNSGALYQAVDKLNDL